MASLIRSATNFVRRAFNFVQRTFMPEAYKERHELAFWRKRYQQEHSQLGNRHYERYYTTFFGLDRDFYRDERIVTSDAARAAAWNGPTWRRSASASIPWRKNA